MAIKPIEWTEQREPNEDCHYTHVIGKTPFGDFLITWKGWKVYDAPTIDAVPWGGWGGCGVNLEDAKTIAERAYLKRVNQCLTQETQNESNTE